MTTYLLDENVLREMRPGGNPHVRAWVATVDDSDLRISAFTFFEKRRGAERLKRKDPERAKSILAGISALESAYKDRMAPIESSVVADWAALLGAKDKNMMDRALAATARVHGFVLVTRNTEDFLGCDVDVLNPFQRKPQVVRV